MNKQWNENIIETDFKYVLKDHKAIKFNIYVFELVACLQTETCFFIITYHVVYTLCKRYILRLLR